MRTLRFFLLAAVLLSSCSKPADTGKAAPSLPENAVARVGSEIITIEDFQEAMRRRPVGENETARSALLDELIQFRVLVQEAKARGYDRDPQAIAAFERLLANKVRAEDQQTRGAQSEVTPQEIETWYRDHQATFTVPAKIRAAMIFVEAPASFSEEKRQERRAALEDAKAKAAGAPEPAKNFGPLAAQFSYDQSTKFSGGDLGYLVEGMTGEGSFEPEVAAGAFALREPGDLSEILSTAKGYYLLKLTERQPATVRPLTAVRDQIRSRLLRDKTARSAESYAAQITSGASVEARRDRLAAIPAPSPARTLARDEASAPPALPSQ